MKILLDENIPTKVRLDFGEGFEVYTVRSMKWLGQKNGSLLLLLDSHNFDFFVTVDKKLKDQQKLDAHKVCVVLLDVPNNKHQTIQPYIEKLKSVLEGNNYKKFIEITL